LFVEKVSLRLVVDAEIMFVECRVTKEDEAEQPAQRSTRYLCRNQRKEISSTVLRRRQAGAKAKNRRTQFTVTISTVWHYSRLL